MTHKIYFLGKGPSKTVANHPIARTSQHHPWVQDLLDVMLES